MTIDQLNKPFKCFYRHTTNNAIGPEVRNESCLLFSTNQRLFISDRYPMSACYDWPNANMLSARVVLMGPHVSHEREVTYFSYQLFLPWEFWRVRELGNSLVPAYMTILREEVWGRFAIANERGYKFLCECKFAWKTVHSADMFWRGKFRQTLPRGLVSANGEL